MNRKIIAFHQDQETHWLARLDCGHSQHVRHQPPLISRQWVLTGEGRASCLGTELDCVRCNDLEFPEEAEWVRETPVFDDSSLPRALQQEHRIAMGEWARIVVLNGGIKYIVETPLNRTLELSPSRVGIVAPQIPHRLIVIGPVELKVQFYRVVTVP
jgi:tellurite resistance-related uncharacterized protein